MSIPIKNSVTPLAVILQGRCHNPNCTDENCDILYLHQRCHMDSPSHTFIDKSDGTITVSCSVCDTPIATFRLERQ